MSALLVGFLAAVFYLHPVGVLRWMQLTRLGWSGITENEIALNDGLMTFLVASGYSGEDPVIMIHGLGPSAALEWRDVMEPLSEAHYKMFAPNLMGFSTSEHKQVNYSIAYQAAAIDQFIDTLKLEHVNLVGHDLGAEVALYEGVEHPDKIERLILVSGGMVGTKGATSLRQNLLPASIAAMRSEVEARFFDLPPMPDFMYERMMTEVARDIPAQSDMLDSVAKDEAHIRSKLGQIFNTLTVIIWGGKDQVVSKNYGETLHSQLPGSATAIFKDTGHDPHLEHPEEFDEAVLFFLKQKEGGR